MAFSEKKQPKHYKGNRKKKENWANKSRKKLHVVERKKKGSGPA